MRHNSIVFAISHYIETKSHINSVLQRLLSFTEFCKVFGSSRIIVQTERGNGMIMKQHKEIWFIPISISNIFNDEGVQLQKWPRCSTLPPYTRIWRKFLQDVDEHMKRQIQMVFWKRVRTQYANLWKLGIKHDDSRAYFNTRKDYWLIAGSPILTTKPSNQKLRKDCFTFILPTSGLLRGIQGRNRVPDRCVWFCGMLAA